MKLRRIMLLCVASLLLSLPSVPEAEEAGQQAFNAEASAGNLMDDFEEEFGTPAAADIFDPLSGYNRAMTTFNDKLYFWVVKPVARGYNVVVPEGGRRAVARFFNNLLFPVRFVNNVLQFKFKGAGVEAGRFCVNSTAGVLGLGDPARSWFGWEPYPEDFGQTLGHYGVGGGIPHRSSCPGSLESPRPRRYGPRLLRRSREPRRDGP